MKQYISPEIDIQHSSYQILAGSPDASKEVGDEGQFNNTGFFDDMEDSYPPKDKGLWDDQYKKDER